MRRRVTIAPIAALAFRNARQRFKQEGAGKRAAKLLEGLPEAPRMLQDAPYIGKEGADHPGRRQLVVSGYRVIYEIVPDTGDTNTAGDVEILALLAPGEP